MPPHSTESPETMTNGVPDPLNSNLKRSPGNAGQLVTPFVEIGIASTSRRNAATVDGFALVFVCGIVPRAPVHTVAVTEVADLNT